MSHRTAVELLDVDNSNLFVLGGVEMGPTIR